MKLTRASDRCDGTHCRVTTALNHKSENRQSLIVDCGGRFDRHALQIADVGVDFVDAIGGRCRWFGGLIDGDTYQFDGLEILTVLDTLLGQPLAFVEGDALRLSRKTFRAQ